jgi:hypothetical protein
MRLPRFRLRTMMILVAVVGVIAGIGIVGERRRARFSELADQHRLQVVNVLEGPTDYDGEFRGDPDVLNLEMRPVTGVVRLRDLWHMAMARKYRRATRYPWLPVEPDPPEPE